MGLYNDIAQTKVHFSLRRQRIKGKKSKRRAHQQILTEK
uniref:Uncharacterized protein n=1 Tax=Rhizophora mucronata TaxID=61149 RepID=A0A2P2IMQ2_RHIMU